MAALRVVSCFLLAAALAHGAEVSPVQKVIELLESCKGKVQKDLAAEAKAMEEYTAFCDSELEEKGYAIKTATRTIADLTADVEDNTAVLSNAEDDIAAVGAVIAEKEKEMAAATSKREGENAAFAASEKEMVESIEELDKATATLKEGAAGSFLQGGKANTKLRGAVSALSTIIEGLRLDTASKRRLHSLLQAAQQSKDDADLGQAPEPEIIESHSGGIVATMEEMQKKAEDGLSELRKKEMEEAHSYEMVKQNLENEMKNSNEKLDQSTKTKADSTEKLAQAQSEMVETKKTKAADEEYSETLKTDCATTAREWEERQKSAAEEMAAIDKAKEILVSGVKALVQIGAKVETRRWLPDSTYSEVDSREDTIRVKLTTLLKGMARKHRSFALAQLASVSAADPFGKIRGLIEGMIEKLVTEAQEEATHEAFCNEEMGKSKASAEEKTMAVEKHQARMDEASTRISQLTESIKTLEAEIAEVDKAVTEATKLRAEENADYKVASKDYRDSAEAVTRAIAVLKSFYEGAMLVQVRLHSEKRSAQPKFGSAKGDAGSSIISILEMSEEDFTTLLAESEETEAQAVEAYEKLSQESRVTRATKEGEAKAAESELKSLTVALENSKEDHASVSAELAAVNDYIAKLKPECESKAMSYEERKAAREAEIDGLKQALEIVSGKAM